MQGGNDKVSYVLDLVIPNILEKKSSAIGRFLKTYLPNGMSPQSTTFLPLT